MNRYKLVAILIGVLALGAATVQYAFNGIYGYGTLPFVAGMSFNWQMNVLACGAKGDGITDDGPAISTCMQTQLNQGGFVGGTVVFPQFLTNNTTRARYLITTPINATGLAFGDIGNADYGHMIAASDKAPNLLCNTGSAPCIDTTGSNNLRIHGLSLTAISQSTPSCIGILMARSTTLGANFAELNTLDHLSINLPHAATCNSSYGSIGVYNYASEIDHYEAISSFADIPLMVSALNTPAVTSPYTTVMTPPQSMTQLTCNDCTLSSQAAASAAVFFDGYATNIDMGNSYMNGAGAGVELGTNSVLDQFEWHGRMEGTGANAFGPIYMNANGTGLLHAHVAIDTTSQNIPGIEIDLGGTNCPQVAYSDIQIDNAGATTASIIGARPGTTGCGTTQMLFADKLVFDNYTHLSLNDGSADAALQLLGVLTTSNITLPTGSSYTLVSSTGLSATVLNSVPTQTTIGGTSGSTSCSESMQGLLKIANCYLNAYAQTGSAQTYSFPTSFVTTPVLQESGGSCGTYNPSTSANTLTLPANAAMTAETCNVVAIGE